MEDCYGRKRGADDVSVLASSSTLKRSRADVITPEELSAEVSIQEQIERCYPVHCLCRLQLAHVKEYLSKFAQTIRNNAENLADIEEELMLAVSFVSWLGDSCHDQLVSGHVCPAIQAVVAHLLSPGGSFLFTLLKLIKVSFYPLFVSSSDPHLLTTCNLC
jgi:hypothetical protein